MEAGELCGLTEVWALAYITYIRTRHEKKMEVWKGSHTRNLKSEPLLVEILLGRILDSGVVTIIITRFSGRNYNGFN